MKSTQEQRLKFRDKFYDNETTRKYHLLKEGKVIGTVLQYNTQGATEIMIFGDDENLVPIEERAPIKTNGYGYNRPADCFQKYYSKYGKDIPSEDLRLLGSGQIDLFFNLRDITVIS